MLIKGHSCSNNVNQVFVRAYIFHLILSLVLLGIIDGGKVVETALSDPKNGSKLQN